MKLITDIFIQMAPNRKVTFMHSLMKAIRAIRVRGDCKVYHEADGQFVQIKDKRLTFGYDKTSEFESDEQNTLYTERELNSALMREFGYVFTIFVEYFSLEYDARQEKEVAVS